MHEDTTTAIDWLLIFLAPGFIADMCSRYCNAFNIWIFKQQFTENRNEQ